MSSIRSTSPNFVKDLASGRKVGKAIQGSRAAVGTVTYVDNFEAADTVTVNGVAFTAMASGAAGNQFNIGVDLAASLTALAVVLNASVVAAVAVATYTVSATVLTVTHDTAGSAGNDYTLAASVGTVSAATLETGTDADALELETYGVFETASSAGGAQAITMPDGVDYQEVTIFMTAKAGGNVVFTGTFNALTTLTFSAALQYARLQWLGGAWRSIVLSGAAIS